jgi:hypothetical protein
MLVVHDTISRYREVQGIRVKTIETGTVHPAPR